MRKKVALILVAVLFCLTLSSCGKQDISLTNPFGFTESIIGKTPDEMKSLVPSLKESTFGTGGLETDTVKIDDSISAQLLVLLDDDAKVMCYSIVYSPTTSDKKSIIKNYEVILSDLMDKYGSPLVSGSYSGKDSISSYSETLINDAIESGGDISLVFKFKDNASTVRLLTNNIYESSLQVTLFN